MAGRKRGVHLPFHQAPGTFYHFIGSRPVHYIFTIRFTIINEIIKATALAIPAFLVLLNNSSRIVRRIQKIPELPSEVSFSLPGSEPGFADGPESTAVYFHPFVSMLPLYFPLLAYIPEASVFTGLRMSLWLRRFSPPNRSK